jgi:PASTA domain
MAAIVEIRAVETTVHCDEKGNAEQKITVHNISSRELRLGARVLVDSPAKEAWVGPVVESGRGERTETEWELAENDTIQLTVPIKAEGAPEGNYSFRVEVYSTEAPGEDYVMGNTLAFKVPPKKAEPVKENKQKFPLWIIAVIVGVLVLIGGGIIMMGGDAKVPSLISLSLDGAKAVLKDKNLKLGTVTEKLTGNHPIGTVIGQKPEANTTVEENSAVDVVIEDEPVPEPSSISVPSVIGQTKKEAAGILSSQGLKLGKVHERRTGGTPGIVLSQKPAANSKVAPGTTIELVLEKQKCKPHSIIIKVGNKNVQFKRNKSWQTCSGYRTIFQGDGNFVVYNPSNKAVWHSGTNGKGGTILAMQTDGNLVIYAPGGRAVWHSKTHGNPGAFLAIQEDGNVVIYNRNSKPIWNTRTNGK